MLLSLLYLTGLSTAHAQLNPPTAEITNALVVDVPPSGFDKIVELIPSLIPLEIAVPDQYFEGGLGWGCFVDVWFNISNMFINATVVDAEIIPRDGYLDFRVSLDVAINDSINPFGLDYELTCIEYNCEGYVNPFRVDVSAQIALVVADTNGDGINDLDAQFNNFAYNYNIQGTDINIENCALGTFEDVLNIFGWSIFDLIINLAGSSIEGAISDLVPTLETTLEDAFSQLTINQTVALGEAELDILIAPENIQIKPDGLRLQMNGGAHSSQVSECVTAFDPNGSLATPSNLQNIGTLGTGISRADFIANVDDDFANQALYSVWRTGLLCLTVDQNTFALDTSILNLLTGDAFVELFPETKPMVIQTVPSTPPTLNVSTRDDLAVHVENLGLDFFATVDDRKTRITNIGLYTDVGVNVPFNGQTGELSVDIILDSDRITPVVNYNEFYPDRSTDIENTFVSQFDTILNLIDIPSMIGDLSFALPSINGVGLSSLQFASAGLHQDNLGVYATLDTVPYTSAGCAGGGCGGGTGCSTTPNDSFASSVFNTPFAIFFGLVGFALIRRRE